MSEHLRAAWRRTALPTSWRPIVGDSDPTNNDDCVILTQYVGRRRYFEVYTYGVAFGNYPTLAAAKAAIEEIYGPVPWTRRKLEPIEVETVAWGITDEFTDPLVIYAADLPRLGGVHALRLPGVREDFGVEGSLSGTREAAQVGETTDSAGASRQGGLHLRRVSESSLGQGSVRRPLSAAEGRIAPSPAEGTSGAHLHVPGVRAQARGPRPLSGSSGAAEGGEDAAPACIPISQWAARLAAAEAQRSQEQSPAPRAGGAGTGIGHFAAGAGEGGVLRQPVCVLPGTVGGDGSRHPAGPGRIGVGIESGAGVSPLQSGEAGQGPGSVDSSPRRLAAYDESQIIRRGISWWVPEGPAGYALAQRLAAGTVTAQEIVRALEPLGIWWGISEQYGGVAEYESHAEQNWDPVVSMLRETEGPEDWFGATCAVVLTAKRPVVGGAAWDPDAVNPRGSLWEGNSYLTQGQPLEVIEVRYDAGDGYRTLASPGIRSTASAEIEVIGPDWVGDYEVVARQGGQTVGRLRGGKFNAVEKVWVDPAHRRQGIATRMYRALEQAMGGTMRMPDEFSESGAAWFSTITGREEYATWSSEPNWSKWMETT